MVLTAKILTAEDKRALSGHVAAIFERNSVAGPELMSGCASWSPTEHIHKTHT
jgi:hypothetical protein